MESRTLTIQFRINETSIKHEQECINRETGQFTDVDFISALDDSVDWQYPEVVMEQYDGLILGGSGELYFDGKKEAEDKCRKISYELLGKLRPLFTYLFEHDIPTLGICYGHQLLGAFAGAQVYYDEQQEKTKSHEVKLMVDKHDYFLFSDLPESFQAHYGHKDVLDRVPEGAVLLMNGGDECKISALKYKQNIYTTQFHPELSFDDMLKRMKDNGDYLPEGTLAEEVFSQDPDSNRILRNFGRFVSSHTESQAKEN